MPVKASCRESAGPSGEPDGANGRRSGMSWNTKSGDSKQITMN